MKMKEQLFYVGQLPTLYVFHLISGFSKSKETGGGGGGEGKSPVFEFLTQQKNNNKLFVFLENTGASIRRINNIFEETLNQDKELNLHCVLP